MPETPWNRFGYKPTVFYSTNTLLAYRINEMFYGQHFVYASPVVDKRSHAGVALGAAGFPASSTPLDLFDQYKSAVLSTGDAGSMSYDQLIRDKRASTLGGAVKQLDAGVISQKQFDRISKFISEAGTDQFLPVLYIIPANKIDLSRMHFPDINDVGHPLSLEFIIRDLKHDEFDIIARGLNIS